MSKSLAKILMYITGTYALLGYGLFLLWFIAIMLNLVLGEISLFPSLAKADEKIKRNKNILR